MEESTSKEDLTASLGKLDLNPNSLSSNFALHSPVTTRSTPAREQRRAEKPPTLENLCLELIGKNLEDILPDLSEIAAAFPADIKLAIAAIARRRRLLNDDVLISLADSSWEILDLSGSAVTDFGLANVAETCKCLRAVDLSRCGRITAVGVSELLRGCRLLHTLRCGGGCPRSERTACSCLSMLKPKLKDLEGDSWEELDTAEIGHGGESLRWFVWPKIDKESLEDFATECPRIIVNPKPSPFGFRGTEVPREALPDIVMDDRIVKDINPKTWAVHDIRAKPISSLSSPNELSMAEKFRLAFVERDTRLAPKRAKNARQHQRRAGREWMLMSTEAKAIALASQASRSLHNRS